MNKYKKIIDQVRAKGDKKAKEKEADAIAEVMCLSVDESPHMIAMEDGAAAVAAMYTLCVEDGLNTVMEYLELRDRLDGLMSDMHDKIREIYPVPVRAASDGQSEPDVIESMERLCAISTEEDTK